MLFPENGFGIFKIYKKKILKLCKYGFHTKIGNLNVKFVFKALLITFSKNILLILPRLEFLKTKSHLT